MNRNTIRLITFLGAFSIVGIIVTQIHWVKKAYELQEFQLNREIYFALKSVAHNTYNYYNTTAPEHKIVNPIKKGYFVVRLTNSIDQDVLERLIKRELQRRNLLIDFEFSVYDCHQQKMSYGRFVNLSGNGKKSQEKIKFPVWSTDSYYFSVNFPSKEMAVLARIKVWSASSIVTLFVIVFFMYTLFIVFKQKRLSEVQKDFINNMTHEFKTPISTITLSSNVLKNPEIIKNPERLKNYANIINDEALRLKKQVERILQMTAVDKINLKWEVLDIHQAIEESVKIIHPSLSNKNGKVIFQLNALNSLAKVDRLHITNVLYNLFDNAIKYNENNPLIEISTQNEGRYIKIRIKDNGIGIPAEALKKIFEKFYRVPTGNIHNVKGFGLGLNYVREILRLHKGKIFVESELNMGSEFLISLPYINDGNES